MKWKTTKKTTNTNDRNWTWWKHNECQEMCRSFSAEIGYKNIHTSERAQELGEQEGEIKRKIKWETQCKWTLLFHCSLLWIEIFLVLENHEMQKRNHVHRAHVCVCVCVWIQYRIVSNAISINCSESSEFNCNLELIQSVVGCRSVQFNTRLRLNKRKPFNLCVQFYLYFFSLRWVHWENLPK